MIDIVILFSLIIMLDMVLDFSISSRVSSWIRGGRKDGDG